MGQGEFGGGKKSHLSEMESQVSFILSNSELSGDTM